MEQIQKKQVAKTQPAKVQSNAQKTTGQKCVKLPLPTTQRNLGASKPVKPQAKPPTKLEAGQVTLRFNAKNDIISAKGSADLVNKVLKKWTDKN